LEQIAVRHQAPLRKQLQPSNAQELRRRVLDAAIERLIQMDAVIYTNMDKLFAIDPDTGEVIVSASPKGSKTINFVERVNRKDNELLYQAVQTLTLVSTAPAFDMKVFRAMDKVCQLVYLNPSSKK
jgi:hypothetical protein